MLNKKEDNIERLLKDNKFIEWIINPNEYLDLYWNSIMGEDIHTKKDILMIKSIFKNVIISERNLSDEEKKELWYKIMDKKRRKIAPFYSVIWFKISAIAAIVASIILGGHFLINSESSGMNVDYYKSLAAQKTGNELSKNVCLILSDNRKLNIDATAEITYDKNGHLHIDNQDIEQKNQEKANTLNRLIVPNGKKANIKLCDGTKICVNSGSCLIYPLKFKSKNREIYVDGEIYLNVTKNSTAPFIVKTNHMDVKVLGTSFNVSAYNNDDNQSVVLVQGAVSVRDNATSSECKITPNHMYEYQKSCDQMSIKKVNVFNYICWQYGFLHLRSEKLSNVLMKLQRYYDVKIDFDSSQLENIRVSGKLDLKDNIQNVLNVISITTPIEYKTGKECIKINAKT